MKRILLKLSGEALAGEKAGEQKIYDEETIGKIALQVAELIKDGNEVAVVTGGGNILRGREVSCIDRTKADSIGMLATVMNCIFVSEIFRNHGMKTAVMTPFQCGAFTQLFSKDAAIEALESGKVVFFAGGTGHPYFSTDTGIALRGIEIEADILLMAKSVDAVYDSDPQVNPNAVRFDTISMEEIIARDLKVIDTSAAILCRDHHLPMKLFALEKENSIVDAARGISNGTMITA